MSGRSPAELVSNIPPMAAEYVEMTLLDYANVLLRRKWIIIVAVLLTTVVAIAFTAQQTPIYSTSSDILVQPRGQDGFFQDQGGYVDPVRSIETEIQVIVGQEVKQRVQDNLGLSGPPPGAGASAVGDTDVISITVTDANAANAAALADAYAVAYTEVRREQSVNELLAVSSEVQVAIDNLQTELDTLAEDDPSRPALVNQLSNFDTILEQLRVDTSLRTGGVAIIRTATVPTVPIEPTPARTAVLAAFVGLLIGLAAAFLLNYLDDKVRSEDDLRRLTGKPVLAIVPVDRPPDNRPVAISQPAHTAVEAYRGLRTNLLFLGLDRPIRVVQVTSSMAAEGKTTTATNLAVVLGQAGHRVALVDADLRRPRVHDVFGLAQSPGFTDLLLGMDAKDVVNHVEIDAHHRISVYTSGAVPSNPSEMLSGQRARQLLSEMGNHYDFVIVDSAPVLPVSDAVALSGAVDGVFVVAHAGSVTNDNIVETVARLDRISAPILGLVLNQATNASAGSYAYGGYNSYAPRVAPNDQRPVTVDEQNTTTTFTVDDEARPAVGVEALPPPA